MESVQERKAESEERERDREHGNGEQSKRFSVAFQDPEVIPRTVPAIESSELTPPRVSASKRNSTVSLIPGNPELNKFVSG